MAADPPPDRRVARLAAADTGTGYDRWAAHYDTDDNPMVAATAWALHRRPLDWAGRRVVELGCGTGRHAAVALAAGAAHFTGVDASAGMLAVAAREHLHARCSWVRAELSAAALPAAAFDRALVVLVLEHLAELLPFCREVCRLLAPGGTLRLLEIHPDLLATGTNAHFHDGDCEVRFTSFHHPVEAIESALQRAGLRPTARIEVVAEGELLATVPRLAKHRGRQVLLDLTAERP